MQRIYALVLLCLFGCTVALEIQARECSPMDFVSTYKVSFTRDQALAYFDQVTKENFSEAKHNFSAAGVLPLDVPIEAQATYEDYSKWWNTFKQTTQYNYKKNESLAILQTMVQPADLEKYRICVTEGYGLSAFLTQNENQAVVKIYWKPAPPVPGQTVPGAETVTLDAYQGDNTVPATQKRDIVINGDFTVEYPLTKGVPFTLIASIGPSTSTSVHAFIPKIFTCTIQNPSIEVTDPRSPIILSHQRTNRYLDGNAHAWMSQFAQTLKSQGKSVISTRYLGPDIDSSYNRVTRTGWRAFAVYIYATIGGEKVYGPDPRCTADEPAPAGYVPPKA